MNHYEKKHLPNSWEISPLESIIRLNPTLDKSTLDDSMDVSFVPMPAVEAESGRIDVSQSRKLGEVKKGYTAFQEGDVLFAKITPCMENGKMAIAPMLTGGLGFGSTEFHVLRCYNGISPEYIYYFVSSKQLRMDAEHNMTGAVGQKRVPTPWLSQVEIPLPPENEQRRIVAKIEELFSELDKAVECLKTAREQLKVYRHALLKHAFEGKLTEQWRRDNADKLESADELLARIQRERDARYEVQVAEWKEAVKRWETGGRFGKKPGKPNPPPSNRAITSDDLSKLPNIPPNWVYTNLDGLGVLARGKSKHRPRNDSRLFGGEYPFIQTGEVKAAKRTVVSYSQTLSEFGLAQSKIWPQGTLCITIAANIAETAFLGFDCCFPDSIVGFSAHENVVSAKYIDFFIMSARVRLAAYAPATAQKNINLTTLENLVVPYVTLEEQAMVVDILDLHFSTIDGIDEELEKELIRIEALRQSILKKAFSGQLVPQDPDDEPAGVLLEQIAAEKAARAGEKGSKAKTGGRRAKATAKVTR